MVRAVGNPRFQSLAVLVGKVSRERRIAAVQTIESPSKSGSHLTSRPVAPTVKADCGSKRPGLFHLIESIFGIPIVFTLDRGKVSRTGKSPAGRQGTVELHLEITGGIKRMHIRLSVDVKAREAPAADIDKQPLPIPAYVCRHIHSSGSTHMLPGIFRHGIVQSFHTCTMEEVHNTFSRRIYATHISEIPSNAEIGHRRRI